MATEQKEQKAQKPAQRAVKPKTAGNAAKTKTAGAAKGRAGAAGTKENTAKQAKTTKAKNKLKIIPIGGVGEIGKNMTVLEYGKDMIVIDCGLIFPDDDMPGIDLVIPDMTYIEKNAEKLRGILLTHGHEDHIGALPFALKQLSAPVDGTTLSSSTA